MKNDGVSPFCLFLGGADWMVGYVWEISPSCGEGCGLIMLVLVVLARSLFYFSCLFMFPFSSEEN